MIDWDEYRVFLQVLRRRGYAAAALEMGIAPATARAAVERLASRLGVALFLHAPEGLAPTSAARDLELVAQAISDSMCAFERMTSGGFDVADGRVAVGVRLGEVFAQEFLIPVLACLLRAHPRLNLDVILDVAQERLLAGAADVMVVAGDFDHAGLDVRRGPTVRLGLYAHRRYLAASGSPTSLARLSDFAVISSRGPGSLNGFAGLVASFPSDVGLAIVCDSGAAQLLAIRSGMGIGAIPNVLAANDPDLVEVLPDIGIDIDTWVAMRREDLDVARIVIVRDALLVRPRPP